MTHDPQPLAPPEAELRPVSARELRKMTPEERDPILERMATLAECLYRDDPELTAFEAFGPDDLHGETSSSETR